MNHMYSTIQMCFMTRMYVCIPMNCVDDVDIGVVDGGFGPPFELCGADLKLPNSPASEHSSRAVSQSHLEIVATKRSNQVVVVYTISNDQQGAGMSSC